MKILLPAIIIFLFSCTSREADQFIPPPPVDSVSYSGDILQILTTYCFGPGYQNPANGPTCHYPPGTYGGIPSFFDDCSKLHDEAISGRLYDFVLGPNATMPLLSQPLPAEDTALIGAWIREEAPCN